MVKGNMTAEKNVIEIKEVNIFDMGEKPVVQPIQPATNSAQTQY